MVKVREESKNTVLARSNLLPKKMIEWILYPLLVLSPEKHIFHSLRGFSLSMLGSPDETDRYIVNKKTPIQNNATKNANTIETTSVGFPLIYQSIS